MRVATLVAPTVSPQAIDHLERNLTAHFGGFTAVKSQGVWLDDITGQTHYDDSNTYSIAMLDTPKNAEVLRAIAYVYGQEAEQISVFYVTADGEATILPTAVHNTLKDKPVAIASRTTASPKFWRAGTQDATSVDPDTFGWRV